MTTATTNPTPGKNLIDLLDEVEKLELNSTVGFFKAYLAILPYFLTQETAFDALNEKFTNITGKTRFKDYSAFRNAIDQR